jgi:hypothetical protein
MTTSRRPVAISCDVCRCRVDNETERKKIEKYAELTTRYQFITIAIETLYPISTEATSFLQELGRTIVAIRGAVNIFLVEETECGGAARKCSIHSSLGKVE